MKAGFSGLCVASSKTWRGVLLLSATIFAGCCGTSSSAAVVSTGRPLVVPLKGHPLSVLEYPSKTLKTAAIILFASGDGGWNDFEAAIANTLQDRGYTVIGIDSASYAATDYDLETLQADFRKIAQTVEASDGAHPPPLIVGGYSMGAAQAIAVAGGPHPPADLKGLLLIDPCSRGRYGLRTADQMNILPTGSGTFSMDEFSRTMGGIRVVQWHAANDSIDSRTWLASLTSPHKEFDFPGAGHDYNHDRDSFLHQFAESLGWILHPDATQPSKQEEGGKP